MNPFVYAVAAGIVMALGAVTEKLGLATTQPYAGLFIRASAALGFLLLSLLPFGRQAEWSGFTGRAVLFIALGALCASVVGQFLYWQSLKATNPAYAYPIMFAASQAAVVLLSLLVLRAKVSGGQLVGVGLVVVGVICIQIWKPA